MEAIRYYKRAMQLVPDIEQKMYTYSKAKGKLIYFSTTIIGQLFIICLQTMDTLILTV